MKFPCKITAVIIRGGERWERPILECQKNAPVWKLCSETARQFESEQWLRSQGFRKASS